MATRDEPCYGEMSCCKYVSWMLARKPWCSPASLSHGYPPPFPRRLPLHCALQLSKPSLFPRFTEQTQNKQRLVLQADLETQRLGQCGHGPVGRLQVFSVPGFPFQGRWCCLEGKPWAMSGTRLALAFLNLKAFRVPKGIWNIQALVSISTLVWFLCTVIRSTHCQGVGHWHLQSFVPHSKVAPPRLPFWLSPSAAQSVCFSRGDIPNTFYCRDKWCSVCTGWPALV